MDDDLDYGFITATGMFSAIRYPDTIACCYGRYHQGKFRSSGQHFNNSPEFESLGQSPVRVTALAWMSGGNDYHIVRTQHRQIDEVFRLESAMAELEPFVSSNAQSPYRHNGLHSDNPSMYPIEHEVFFFVQKHKAAVAAKRKREAARV